MLRSVVSLARSKYVTAQSLDAVVESRNASLAFALNSALPPTDPTCRHAMLDTRPSHLENTFHLPLDIEDLTTGDSMDLLRYFSEPPYTNSLHPHYLKTILTTATSILADLPSVGYINSPKVIIVGDLHGSLPDLHEILTSHGPPSPSQSYIFNGDLVDRGPHSTEVLTTVLSLLVSSRNEGAGTVWINRGNHEDSAVARAYGFHDELARKGTPGMWKYAEGVFGALPLGCGVNGGTFVCHGGPVLGMGIVERGRGTVMNDAGGDVEIMRNVVWSDPDLEVGGIRTNESRGCGNFYGKDIAVEFLQAGGFNRLVRSHEPVYNGVSSDDLGNGMSIHTVFSATDYPNFTGSNEAGVMIIGKNGTADTVTWEAEEWSVDGDWMWTKDDVETSLKREIFLHKPLIKERLKEVSGGARRISIDVWSSVMKEVTGLNVDWAQMQPALAQTAKRFRDGNLEDTGLVDITHFMSHFADHADEADRVFREGRNLFKIFTYLDVDGSGSISLSEFLAGMTSLNSALPTDDKMFAGEMAEVDRQIKDLFLRLDRDGNGEVDLEEFRQIDVTTVKVP